jgi:hypothetical protein
MHAVDQHRVAVPNFSTPDRRLQSRLVGPAHVHLEMAQWLLAREMSDARDMLGVSEAAERACRKLLDRLARLITPSGCQALLSRALHLAQADFRFLRGIQPKVTAGTYLEGLSESAEGTDPGQVHRGLVSLLGTLMELIALFIGEYLMGRMLLEVWPDLPAGDPTRRAGAGK